MADDLKNKTISKSNTGFPAYLNFDTLRSSSIEYLGKLSGKIWTDHNVHDPGITILEVLIYALLDLGYRTNLPAEDLFSRDPADKSADNNFFSTSHILGNNPLTITDYRKLLVDLAGVKNAWLEVDVSSPVIFCKYEKANPEFNESDTSDKVKDPCSCDILNGLYHVYIQLEDDIENDNHKKAAVVSKIKKNLMAHRNLCEDFVDIKILCSLEIGICADIELESNADAEEVYIKIVAALQEYFSPAPIFYSLQEMLDKKKPIDEIFAGRPYNITESHGFIDTEEFERLTLRKELHLSDVYHVLFDIEGISSVRNLGWIKCCEKKESNQVWKLVLPENNIPKFSADCSGFTFTRNQLPVNINQQDFEVFLKLKNSGLQKALYKTDSPYLDPELPKGVYRSDLAEYYSIQNDFPAVYGIGKGGLQSNVPDSRKAQALQLQGFLLFFDQLLANYLTQLKNIRTLFALSSTKDDKDQHTYFINQLNDAPQLEKLLRFRNNAGDESSMGTTGGTLAYPTARKNILDYIENGKVKDDIPGKPCCDDIEKIFSSYNFCHAIVRDQAINQLKNDQEFNNYTPVTVINNSSRYFFYIDTSANDFVLISKNTYASEKEAASAAASVQYVATFSENYRSFIGSCCENNNTYFSFDIDLNLDVYVTYLQKIVEDKELYAKRRQGFLDHLMARFSETFSDFALLSAPFLNSDELQLKQIKVEEKMLSHYDNISSNRGKGFNYLKNKWGNDNISGFEKRFKALSGIENWNQHYLCNFVVEKADALYKLSIDFFNEAFTVKEKTVGYEEAFASLQSVYKKLSDPLFCEEFVPQDEQWGVYLQDDFGNKYFSQQLFTEENAVAYKNRLNSLFKFNPNLDDKTFVNRYIHKVLFTDHNLNLLAESKEVFDNIEDANAFANSVSNKLPGILNTEAFKWEGKNIKIGKLTTASENKYPLVFIDETRFLKFQPIEVKRLKEITQKFSITNKEKTIQFDSLIEYKDFTLAQDAFKKVLPLLAVEDHYLYEENKQTGKWEIFIAESNEKLVKYVNTYISEEDAKKIFAEIQNYTYKLFATDLIAYEWEFKYRSEDLSGDSIDYISDQKYLDKPLAETGVKDFYNNIPLLKSIHPDNRLQLILDKDGTEIHCFASIEKPSEEIELKADEMLRFKQDLFNKVYKTTPEEFAALLEKNRTNPRENYIYKLVDKDNLIGYYPFSASLPTKTIAEQRRTDIIGRHSAGYNYIDISLSHDIIRERKDGKTKVIWYHYLIKCNNRQYTKGKVAGKNLVLFESAKGYESKEEALKAFDDQYLLVLKYARYEKYYGNQKLIGTKEVLIHITDTGPCSNVKTITFIPDETTFEFGGNQVQNELMPIAQSYPVQFIRKNKYRFVVGQIDVVGKKFTADWQSSDLYRTVQDVTQELKFFLILLKYQGNYYIEWDPTNCRFHIYIREVLAISAHGFEHCDEAWGKDGVEKFICVSQSEKGFHNYFNRNDCSNNFFVACGNTGLVHPCVYDTVKRRDDALLKLYQSAGFNFFDFIETGNGQSFILKYPYSADEAKDLATIHTSVKEPFLSICDALMALKESVSNDSNYIKKDGTFYLNYKYKVGKKESYFKIAEPSSDIGLKEWKMELQKMADYFPVIRKESDCNGASTGKKKYFVEIKLPGFDCLNEESLCTDSAIDPCMDDGCKISCYVAWKSDCCFDTCCDALKFYSGASLLLKDHANYKPLYDCDCLPYRIGLYPQLASNQKEAFIKKAQLLAVKINTICNERNRIGLNSKNPVKCVNEIVAFNPQHYDGEQMACKALVLAKKLINSEGLELVEHILLRPRCKSLKDKYIDCDCDGLPVPCDKIDDHKKMIDCHFQWLTGGDIEPCEKDKSICFTPGCDPYSFISTIALPAWPQRFRNKANRKIIEKLLHREAPAHVLLRILWLNPRDFCCFEYYFEQWTLSMAKQICSDYNYSNCDFLRILFKKQFLPLAECEDCIPCSCGDKSPASCQAVDEDTCENIEIINNINQLFCWSDKNNFDFTKCEACEETPVTAVERKRILASVIEKSNALRRAPSNEMPFAEDKTEEVADTAPAAKEPGSLSEPSLDDLDMSVPEDEIVKKVADTTYAKAVPISVWPPRVNEMPVSENEIKEVAEEKTIKKDDLTEADIFRVRNSKYKEKIQEVLARNEENAVAKKAMIFLKKPPLPQDFSNLINDILNDKTDKIRNIRGLSKSDKNLLIQNISWKYLDLVCFNNSNDIEKITTLKPTFKIIKNSSIDISSIYKDWNSNEFSQFKPAINFNKIKNSLKGS